MPPKSGLACPRPDPEAQGSCFKSIWLLEPHWPCASFLGNGLIPGTKLLSCVQKQQLPSSITPTTHITRPTLMQPYEVGRFPHFIHEEIEAQGVELLAKFTELVE